MEQRWFGWVEEINDESFNVRLKDLSPENRIVDNGTDEEAIILYKDISEDDRKTIMLGSTFHWTINEDGSFFKFVEPPTKDEIKQRNKIATDFYQSMINSKFFD